MTRKDYQKLAELLGTAKRESLNLEIITSALITILTADNPRFNRSRFLEAIEKEENR